MNILHNAWFVDIVTGIISGIVATWLFQRIMDMRSKTEYYKKVRKANDDVISLLKPYMADKGLPEPEILNALISSTARAYAIDEQDMFTVNIFCEELMREILSDVYVSNDKKQEYSTLLANYKKDHQINRDPMKSSLIAATMLRERFKTLTAISIGLLSGLMGMAIVLMTFSKSMVNPSFWFPFEKSPILWLPILIFITLILFGVCKVLEHMNVKRTVASISDSAMSQNAEEDADKTE